MVAIVGKKGSKGCGRIFGVVIAEFGQREEAGPAGLLVVAVHSEVLLQHRIETLRLPIRLRGEGGGPIGPNATDLLETPPQV